VRSYLVTVLATVTVAIASIFLATCTWAQDTRANSDWNASSLCGSFPFLCTDPVYLEGGPSYVGHDEPAVLFYSTTPGAGNSFKGLITLPKDSKTKPNQAETGGTWNFQLHPAFWFGMAMCDTQSAPETATPCTPDSDTNIYNDSSGSRYIGKHPGTAFMEMQFYPPGWVIAPNTQSCSATKWCAALTIDSYSYDMNHNIENNSACVSGAVGIEPVNFAYITKSGNSVVPASPLTGFQNQLVVTKDVFLMSPGDTIEVRMFDNTAADPAGGFEVILTDLTTGKSGSMTANINNGFAQVNFQPSAASCTATPYSFHPMYSTSTPDTRVPWAAHSYNVAYSDEVGHFEYCNSVDPSTGDCLDNNEGIDGDDFACFDASQSSKIKVGGCQGEDFDFDGPTYLPDWPGTDPDAKTDSKLHARPVVFNGSLIGSADGAGHQFDSTAFEADLPIIESNFGTGCSTVTGDGCSNPPPGASFYPFFSTGTDANGGCVWQEGGANLPNSNYSFNGITYADSTEFGTFPVSLVYPTNTGPTSLFDDFQQPVASNPCLAALPNLTANTTAITFKNTKVGKTSAAKTVKLSNSLTDKNGMGLIVSANLDDTTDFTIAKNTCTKELLPKKHCTISVKAIPSSATTLSGNLTIQADSANGPLTIPLSVTGD